MRKPRTIKIEDDFRKPVTLAERMAVKRAGRELSTESCWSGPWHDEDIFEALLGKKEEK